MRFSQSVFSAFMASVAADPPPKEISLQSPEELKLKDGTIMTVTSGSKRSPEEIKLADGTTMTVSDDAHEKRAPTNVKRSVARRNHLHSNTLLANRFQVLVARPRRSDHDIQLRDGSWLHIRDTEKEFRSEPSLVRRDKISSCGPRSGWMPRNDHGEVNGVPMYGYDSVVADYCARVSWDYNGNSVIVAAGKMTSYTVRWQYDGPDISDELRGQRVGLKGKVPGHVEFEIHNKRESEEYKVDERMCIGFLMTLADPNFSCYGPNNNDTKGGTWEMENNHLTLNALPANEDGDPQHDGLRV